MKKSFAIIVLALIASLATAQKSVTFVVDENLAPVNDLYAMEHLQKCGSKALEGIFHDEGVPGDTHAMIAWSFSDNEQFYTFTGKDPFFKTIVRAYAEHRPLVLSPDMIWVLISQGFARYVNAHSEQLRDQIVSHTEKMDLVVLSDKELLSEDADWEKMMSDFTAQINENTKGDIAQTITADFTTTGITERITSQITLMETMKSYFDYIVHYIACGIPSITLQGTPEDWQKIVEKTKRLEKYGIGKWTKSLEPILTEFVKASKGKPNQAFWQGMVKKHRVDELAGGGCDLRKPTELDGWILKLFPDEDGVTPDKVPQTHKMPSERVYVDFLYQIINRSDGSIIHEVPLQLSAGFIGTEIDTQTHALKPKMGWVVRQMKDSESIVKRLEKLDSENSFSGIDLRVNKVPEHLSQLSHIKRLTLCFTNRVTIPEWFYNLQIDHLTIEGEISDELEGEIWEHFPKAILNYKGAASRGIASGTDEPLIIVDGTIFKGKLSDIDPATIKSQRVLKDATATAIYGFQGANGVIEITTKDYIQQPSTDKKTKKKDAVKAGDKISGTVSDDMSPLMGATVCEIGAHGRIIESTVTDDKGHFTMKVKNPEDHLRFSYVGLKTIFQAIDRKEYYIKMNSVEKQNGFRYIPIERRRQANGKGLPIPQKEISMPEFEELGFEEGNEVVSNENNPRIQVSLSDEEQSLVMSVNDLGFNLFRKVGANENILLSPLGMTYVLGLINNGAAGKTRMEINKVLGCDDKKTANINMFCRKMLTEASKLDKLAKLQITNDFFSPKYAELKPTFAKVAKDSYDTQFKTSDSAPFSFTLVNTIDFKGIWTDKFRKGNTQDELFMRENGKTQTVPMMKQHRQFFYTENNLCQALCLPYSNGAYQMIVLLPKVGKTVKQVAESLTSDSWDKCYDAMRRVDVDVKLPRFESSSEVDFTGVMSALIPNAFSVKKADFSNLFDFASSIAKIKQTGHIKVDETGTEATVATFLQGSLGGLNIVQPETVRFYATRPFLYFIREWSTGTIFFIGQYTGT